MAKKTHGEETHEASVVLLDSGTGNTVTVLDATADADGNVLVECEAIALKGPYRVPAVRLVPVPTSSE